MKTDKEALRRLYKQRRREVSKEDHELLSQQILERVKVFLEKNSDLEHFHVFFPIATQKEINTFLIKNHLVSKGKTVYTSRVIPGSLTMETLKLESNTDFYLDDWGIPIPTKYELVEPHAIQVVFIPLLAFDQEGSRIGFGKGFYDVFLKGLEAEVFKVGLSFFEPEVKIPSEPHDVKLDFCITPHNTYSF